MPDTMSPAERQAVADGHRRLAGRIVLMAVRDATADHEHEDDASCACTGCVEDFLQSEWGRRLTKLAGLDVDTADMASICDAIATGEITRTDTYDRSYQRRSA